MTLQDKFDDIINYIELLVKNGEENIPQELARKTGLNLRLLGDAFQFITDMTLIKYIRQRRLVHALTSRMEQNLSIEDVAASSLFSDAAAFSKACKSEFNLNPGQITREELNKYPPLRFAQLISNSATDLMENEALRTQMDDTPKGVTEAEFAEVKQALEISALYGFNDEESESVYRLAKELDLTFEDAAELCEEARIEEKHDIFSSEMHQALREIKGYGYSHIYELPEGFFDVYFSSANDRHGWFVPYICEIVEALKENGLSADNLDYIELSAFTHGIDIIEAIERYDEYK